MLAKLIKKEILEHLMSLRFAIACVLCFSVVLTSFFVRSKDYENKLDDYHYHSATDRVAADDFHNPWAIRNHTYTINRAPNPLSIFVRGVGAGGGRIEVHVREPARLVEPDLTNTSVPLFPTIDLVVFVGLILSLMAIVFGFDTVCGEKQRGTLRLMLSFSVPRDAVLIAKWIGGYVTLVVPYLLSLVSLLSLVMVQERINLTSSEWWRFLGIIVLSLVFLATVFSMAVLVSCSTDRPATSIMLLVTLWVILFLAVPNLSAPLATMILPTQPAHALAAEQQAVRDHARERDEAERDAYDKANGFGDDWWEHIDWNGPWNSDRQRAGRRWQFTTRLAKDTTLEMQKDFERIEERRRAEIARQTVLNQWLSRISPFACFAMASAELAGEGPYVQHRFMKAVFPYQEALTAHAYDALLFWCDYEYDNQGKKPVPWKKHWTKKLPTFTSPKSDGELLHYVGRIAVDAGILGGLAALFFMLSYTRFIRYDVR